MAQSQTVNPYPSIGQQMQTGLAAIGATLQNNPNPTTDDLVNAVFNFIEPLYYSGASLQVQTEIKSVAYNAINSTATAWY